MLARHRLFYTQTSFRSGRFVSPIQRPFLLDPTLTYAHSQQTRYLDELVEFLRIPSISTLPEHRSDIDRAAEYVRRQLVAAGLENAAVIATSGHPLAYADWLHAPDAPTILCYGHYDVQPPDPLGEWVSPPFEPELRAGELFARGAADDKGQVFTHVKAAEAYIKSGTALPVNVRYLIEGEEEVGGTAIDRYVRDHAAQLACDAVLVSDTTMFAPELPTIDVGLRGMVYAEVHVQGAESDLHSGLYGGVAPNPFEALARIIAGLKQTDGHIAIPGFYDDVRMPSVAERSSWSRLPFDEEEYRRGEVRADALVGEVGYSALERTWVRPTLEVHGMPGGFIGRGAKTVIPARAAAKISMRLVPDQSPEKIFAAFAAQVRALAPKGVRVNVELLNTADPVVVDPENRFVHAASLALHEVFGKAPVFVRSGGSIPIVTLFSSILRAPTVMMGFALADCGAHAPNEKLPVANYYRGIDSVIRFFEHASQNR